MFGADGQREWGPALGGPPDTGQWADAWDREGQGLRDSAGMAAPVDEVRRAARKRGGMTEVDARINAPAVSEAAPALFGNTRSVSSRPFGHARIAGAVFRENGALRCAENRGDFPEGEITPFPPAARRQAAGGIVFAHAVWSSKGATGKAMGKITGVRARGSGTACRSAESTRPGEARG